jgi:hypothetical protein
MSSLEIVYGSDHKLGEHYEISISQMAMDRFLVTWIFYFIYHLCVLKMFDAKIYLWHLQAFLISGAKIKKINYILIEV